MITPTTTSLVVPATDEQFAELLQHDAIPSAATSLLMVGDHGFVFFCGGQWWSQGWGYGCQPYISLGVALADAHKWCAEFA